MEAIVIVAAIELAPLAILPAIERRTLRTAVASHAVLLGARAVRIGDMTEVAVVAGLLPALARVVAIHVAVVPGVDMVVHVDHAAVVHLPRLAVVVHIA